MATKTTDEAVMELLVTVARNKKEIEALKKRPQWKTNCSFGFSTTDTHDRINIGVERDPRVLIEFYIFLMKLEEYMQKAASELGLDVEMTHLAYPIEEWKTDLKARAGQLLLEKKKKEMEVLDARVNKLVSPDQRRKMELVALQKILAE